MQTTEFPEIPFESKLQTDHHAPLALPSTMAEDADDFHPPPSILSMASFSPNPRRLSSHFSQPRSPMPAAARRLSWLSEEASWARAAIGRFRRDDGAAWQLFCPLQRFLMVAVVGAAAAKSEKDSLISQLKNAVQQRDDVLSSMQQKLDNLCEQLHCAKDQPGSGAKILEKLDEAFCSDKNVHFLDCGCLLCDQHVDLSSLLKGDSGMKAGGNDKLFQQMMKLESNVEQEERRMSDLSDWAASSITSSAEIQLNNLAIEQDIFNVKRECEEKDAMIKELNAHVKSSNAAGSKRISELEDIIRRKNTTITRLKKDMVVLEQKLVQLTRTQRSSSSTSSLNNSRQLPVMNDNVLYDMDSTTSPSSSDSDVSPRSQPQTSVNGAKEDYIQNHDFGTRRQQGTAPALALSSVSAKSRPASPLQEISLNEKSDMRSPTQLSARGDVKGSRTRVHRALKNSTPRNRWL